MILMLSHGRSSPCCLFFVSLVWFIVCSSGSASEEFFEKRVRPMLIEHCVRCHGPKEQRGGLRLDSRAALMKGGESGAVVRPGEPEKSLLVGAIRRTGELKMPPKTPRAPEMVELLTAWVKMGAPWPADRSAESAAEAWKRHWAFGPVKNPPLPNVRQGVTRAKQPHRSRVSFVAAAGHGPDAAGRDAPPPRPLSGTPASALRRCDTCRAAVGRWPASGPARHRHTR
jgi:hypothetical protein